MQQYTESDAMERNQRGSAIACLSFFLQEVGMSLSMRVGLVSVSMALAGVAGSARAQSTTLGGGAGNGTMPEFIVNPLTQEQILEVRNDLGVIDDDSAHESIQQLVFGQASDSLDVLRLDRDAFGNLLGTATAADGRVVPASIGWIGSRSLTAEEQVSLNAPLVTEVGYSFIRLTGQSGDVYTWGMTYERDGELLIIPSVWLSSSSKAEEAFNLLLRQNCGTCQALFCTMDSTAQLKYDMAVNYRDGADYRAKWIGIGSGVLCAGASVATCLGTLIFPPLGPVCGAALVCSASFYGCTGIAVLVNSSRLQDYYDCLCLESQGRANGVEGVECPSPEFNDCAAGN